MDTWLIILIIVVGGLVLAGLAWAATRGRERRVESKRVEAGELRQEAQVRTQRADEREGIAQEQAEQARRERLEAESELERADKVDPDSDR